MGIIGTVLSAFSHSVLIDLFADLFLVALVAILVALWIV